MAPDIAIRPARAEDAAGVAAIYNHYVANSTTTLQAKPVPAAEFGALIEKSGKNAPFLVGAAAESGELLGYCYADILKSRCGYLHTYEVSIYAASSGGGIGGALMSALLQALEKTPAYRLVAVITLPNAASVALHEKFGFTHCGTLPQAGWKFNKWLDLGYWMLQLKKGSPAA